jgi:peptide/nickel transport system substrate-binding protein
MAHSNWEVSDGPNLLVYPQWLVPMESSRWAPLEGEMYHARGTSEYTSEQDVDPYKRKPPRLMPDEHGPIRALWDLFDRAISEPDPMQRHRLAWKMCRVHIDEGPFFQGTVAGTPQVEVASVDMGNVPRRENLATGGYVNTWVHPTPAVYDPEAYFWRNPDQHRG